jgi:hypothetical protein
VVPVLAPRSQIAIAQERHQKLDVWAGHGASERVGFFSTTV